MWLESVKYLGPTIVGVISIVASLIINSRIMKSKSKDCERDQIQAKINDFYGPFIQLRKKSNILYKLFIKDKESEFRTLLALLNGEKFYNNDKMLLNEIIEIDQKLERLIIEKSGYIEDSNLSELFSKAAIHFNIMYQAYNGTLSGEVERFKEYIYPRELDEEVNREVTKLKKKMRKLNKC